MTKNTLHRPLASTPPGRRGHTPNILVGTTSTGISPQYYYVLSDIADQYWLPSDRSASSRFHSSIRRHQFASVRQADSRLTRLVSPTLYSRWRHWHRHMRWDNALPSHRLRPHRTSRCLAPPIRRPLPPTSRHHQDQRNPRQRDIVV